MQSHFVGFVMGWLNYVTFYEPNANIKGGGTSNLSTVKTQLKAFKNINTSTIFKTIVS